MRPSRSFTPGRASFVTWIQRLRAKRLGQRPNGRSSGFRQRLLSWSIALSISLSASVAAAGPVAATHYDNTNPLLTPCGDGSHPVETIRNFYLKTGGLAYARLDLRWSKYCNTVWTRVMNITGSGAGYASERKLLSDERITVYTCPRTACQAATQTEFGDVLPGNGDTAFSLQLTMRSGSSLGTPAAKQPPSLRGYAKVYSATGVAITSFDTQMEPMWTWMRALFKNDWLERNDGTVMSCNNGASSTNCHWWGQPGGASKTVWYELHPSLNNAPGVDIVADIKNVIIPAWSQATPRSPIMKWCNAPCAEHMLVEMVSPPDPDIGLSLAATQFTAGTGVPTLVSKGWIKINNPDQLNPGTDFDHSCGAVDDGCELGAPGTYEARTLISHEFGHSLGLFHCDLNHGVMCGVKSTLNSSITFGKSYWTPQTRDELALSAFYP